MQKNLKTKVNEVLFIVNKMLGIPNTNGLVHQLTAASAGKYILMH